VSPPSPVGNYEISDPFVVQLPNGTFRMYFEGSDGNHRKICSAWSLDSINWVQENGIRIDVDSGNFGSLVRDPEVVLISNGWRMYYSSTEQMGGTWTIRSATSQDGLLWVKEGVRLSPSVSGYDDKNVVLGAIHRMENGTLRMYYSGNTKADNECRVLFADSVDGLNWIKNGTVLLAPSTYGGIGELYPGTIIKLENGSLRMYLQGSNPGTKILSAISQAPFGISKRVSFEVDDPFNQPFFIMTNKTNTTGNATVSFTLPMDAPEGTYNCSATANVSGEVLSATTLFEVIWPWSPVFNSNSDIVPTRIYFPGDPIGLTADASYEYLPAAATKPAPGFNLSAEVFYPNGTLLMNVTRQTDPTGRAALGFTVPEIDVCGTYTIRVSGFMGLGSSSQFQAGPRELPLFFGIVNVIFPSKNINRGGTVTVGVIINNSLKIAQPCKLVVQRLDSNNVPVRPIIQDIIVPVNPAHLVNVQLTINAGAPIGKYTIQFQLLTDLPKRGGYALSFWNDDFTVN